MSAKNHGPSIKDDEQYASLRDKSYSKESAARIANTDRQKAAARGGESPPYEQWNSDDLYQRARELEVDGRSRMDRTELIESLRNS